MRSFALLSLFNVASSSYHSRTHPHWGPLVNDNPPITHCSDIGKCATKVMPPSSLNSQSIEHNSTKIVAKLFVHWLSQKLTLCDWVLSVRRKHQRTLIEQSSMCSEDFSLMWWILMELSDEKKMQIVQKLLRRKITNTCHNSSCEAYLCSLLIRASDKLLIWVFLFF